MVLKFENITIERKSVELIQTLSTELSTGQFVILTGANGAGKSTLLKTLVGLKPISNGQIFINAKPISAYDHPQRALLMSFINSKKIEEDYIRVVDLVRLGRYPYLKVMSEQKIESPLIDAYMEALGLKTIQEKFLNEISDGELQKANIARTLAQDTPIVLMDEPSAFLDYPSKKLLFKLLRQLAIESNKIIICATHDVELAGKFGTQFWHLENKVISISDKSIAWTAN